MSFLSSRNRSDTVWLGPCTLLALQPSRTEWFVTARLFLAKTQANLCDFRRCVPWAARAIRNARLARFVVNTFCVQWLPRSDSRIAVRSQRFAHSAVRAQSGSHTAWFALRAVRVQRGSYTGRFGHSAVRARSGSHTTRFAHGAVRAQGGSHAAWFALSAVRVQLGL